MNVAHYLDINPYQATFTHLKVCLLLMLYRKARMLEPF